MRSPRILCLIDSLGKGGGAEQLIATLVPKLAARGVDIAVAPVADWPVNHHATLIEAGIPLHPLKSAVYGKVRFDGLRRVRALAERERYDIYWGHLVTGIALAKTGAMASGGKSIATIHSEGYVVNPPRRLRDRLAVRFERRLVSSTDARVAVSNAVARDYAAFFGWDDIAIAYNGVDVAAIKALAATHDRAAIRTEFGIAPDDFLTVTAARYVTKKGQKYLLEAAAQLVAGGMKGLKLLFCGSGGSAPLRAEAARLGLGDVVIIEDVLDQTQLMPLIAAADAYVMPSLREPFGIAAAEAMALGTPTVLTETDGFLELVGDSGTALMAPPADGPALANRIAQVRSDPAAARAMGERAARRIADRFSLDACASRWIEIFDAVQHDRAIPPCAA